MRYLRREGGNEKRMRGDSSMATKPSVRYRVPLLPQDKTCFVAWVSHEQSLQVQNQTTVYLHLWKLTNQNIDVHRAILNKQKTMTSKFFSTRMIRHGYENKHLFSENAVKSVSFK